jgi:hypothetical protein
VKESRRNRNRAVRCALFKLSGSALLEEGDRGACRPNGHFDLAPERVFRGWQHIASVSDAPQNSQSGGLVGGVLRLFTRSRTCVEGDVPSQCAGRNKDETQNNSLLSTKKAEVGPDLRVTALRTLLPFAAVAKIWTAFSQRTASSADCRNSLRLSPTAVRRDEDV